MHGNYWIPRFPSRTIEQMAERLDCSKGTIYSMIKEGAPHWRYARRIYLDEEKLLQWMEDRK